MHRLRVATLLLLCIGPAVGLAHGPAPAALGALGDGSGGFSAVHTNIGLAVARPQGGYYYMCPIHWGAEDLFPPIAKGSDGSLLLPMAGDLYRGDGCGFTAEPLVGWDGRMAGSHGGFLLERRGSGARIWDLRAAPVVVASIEAEVPVDSLLATSSEVLYGLSRGAVSVHRAQLSPPGTEVLLQDGPTGDYVSIRTASPLMFVLSRGDRRHLYEVVDGQAVLRLAGVESLHGPVVFEDGWAAVADGVLVVNDGVTEVLRRPVDWVCILEVEGALYACRERGLWRIEPGSDWSSDEVAFELDQIVGLEEACLPEGDGRDTVCRRQWLHFGAEAGLVRGDAGLTLDGGVVGDRGEMTPNPHGPSGGGGCTVAAFGDPLRHPVLLPLLLMGLAWFRLRYGSPQRIK